MDNTSSLGCFRSLPDGPLPDFVCTSGEEAAQAQALTHSGDNLRQCRLGAEFLALLLSFRIGFKASQTLLERDGERDYRIASRVGLNPFRNLGDILILLANIIPLAKVDKINNRLGRQKEKWVNDFDLCVKLKLVHTKIESFETSKTQRSTHISIGLHLNEASNVRFL